METVLKAAILLFALFAIGPTPEDTLKAAVADLQAVPDHRAKYCRYLWVESGEANDARAMSFAVNTISRATVPVQVAAVKGESVTLLRVDLGIYFPRDSDLSEVTALWEEFRFDPRFNLLLTRDTVLLLSEDFVWPKLKASRQIEAEENGKRVRKWQEVPLTREMVAGGEVDVARITPEVLDPHYRRLVELTGSQAPVVTGSYFLVRALSTIQDDGLYKTLYGGLYYELAGIKKSTKQGTSDLDLLLDSIGIKGGAKVFDEIRSDQRVAMMRSQVTGGPRRVDLMRALAGRDGQGSLSITHDLKAKNIDIGTHPLANLLDVKADAGEIIWDRQNGLHGYALVDGKGNLQAEAPPDVARDHTIPAPHHGRLQSAISCIRCHEAEGSDGWKSLTNDVHALAKSLDIFGDRKGVGRDSIDRLVGLYAGSPNKWLSRARDDYADSVLRSTGPWPNSKDQADVVKLTGSQVAAMWKRYHWDMVDATSALREIGREPKAKDTSLEDLRAVIRLPPGSIEDPRLAALISGLAINRADWDLVYGFAYERSERRKTK